MLYVSETGSDAGTLHVFAYVGLLTLRELVGGILVEDGLVSLVLGLVVLLRAIDVGELDKRERHDVGVLVGVVDGLLVGLDGVVVALQVHEAVALEAVGAGGDDFVADACVLKIFQSLLVVTVAVEADCHFQLGAVAAFVAGLGGFLVEIQGYAVVSLDVGLAGQLVGLGIAALVDEEPGERCHNNDDCEDEGAHELALVGLSLCHEEVFLGGVEFGIFGIGFHYL